jgi:uncharacterized protein YsxB (DUF464 family)
MIDIFVSADSGTHYIELKRVSQKDDRSCSLLKMMKIMEIELERLEDEYNRTKC